MPRRPRGPCVVCVGLFLRRGRRSRPRQRAVVAGDTSLRTVCLASAAFEFFLAAVMTVCPLPLPQDLHLSGTVVGLARAATGPGALLGSRPRRMRRYSTGSRSLTTRPPVRPSRNSSR